MGPGTFRASPPIANKGACGNQFSLRGSRLEATGPNTGP